jgi:hypothetical protein
LSRVRLIVVLLMSITLAGALALPALSAAKPAQKHCKHLKHHRNCKTPSHRKNPTNTKNPKPTCANASGGACSYSGTTSQGGKVQFVVAAGRGRSSGVAVDSFTVILQETCTDGQTLMGGTGFLTTPIDTQGHFSYTTPGQFPLHVSGQLQEPTGQPGSGASGTVEETRQGTTEGATCHVSVTFTATSHK